MATTILPGESGASVRAKLMAYFGQADATVASLIELGRNTGQIQAGVESIVASLAGVTIGVQNASRDISRHNRQIDDLNLGLGLKADRSELAALASSVVTQRYEHTESATRPGEAGLAFTFVSSPDQLGGRNADLPTLPDALRALGDDGPEARIAGTGIIAMRRSIAVEPGRVYRARAVLRRRANASDPSNDTVRVAIIWLDQARNVLAGAPVQIVKSFPSLMRTDGRQTVRTTFARSAGDGIAIVAPYRARFARLFLQSYGVDGVVAAQVLDIEDVTDLTLPAPVTTDALDRIDVLESFNAGGRLSAIEAALNDPSGLTFETQTDAAAATVEPTVTSILTRGLASPGDGKAGSYYRVVSPVGADFTSADGAHWKRFYESYAEPQAGGVTRGVLDKLYERKVVADFYAGSADAAFAAASVAAGSGGMIEVNEERTLTSRTGSRERFWHLRGMGARTPIDKIDGPVLRTGYRHDTDAFIDLTGGTGGGFFSDYLCLGAASLVDRQDVGSAITDTPFIIDTLFVHNVDGDTTVHPAETNRAITNGFRSLVVGIQVDGEFQKQYKDIVAVDGHAIARIDDILRGVSGGAYAAIQLGRGLATNEFAAQNPSDAFEQSVSMAGVQGILRNQFAASDAEHVAVPFRATSDQSFLSTAALLVHSYAHPSITARDGAFMTAIDLGLAKVRDSAIRMPTSRSGADEGAGGRIEYAANRYTDYLPSADLFRTILGSGGFGVTSWGISVGAASAVTGTRLYVGASTADLGHFQFVPGVAPAIPGIGVGWFDGTNVFINTGAGVMRFKLERAS